MRKILLTILLIFACCTISMAQQAKIGYFSMQDLLNSDADYQEMMASAQTLREQYAEELKIAEKDFKEKYELFLEQQASLAPTIREKRQLDLQTLLERTEKFRAEAEETVKKTESEAKSKARDKYYNIIHIVAERENLLLVINLDNDVSPYVNPLLSVDITDMILSEVSEK